MFCCISTNSLFSLEDAPVGEIDIESASLDDIRGFMRHTRSIYVCLWGERDLDTVCSGDDVVRVIDDLHIVTEFVYIASSLEDQSDRPWILPGNPYILHLLDSDRQIIVSIDFPIHFRIRTPNWGYFLDASSNDRLLNILGIRPLEVNVPRPP